MILISGPCVIESAEQLDRIARALDVYAQNSSIDFYFKASFDKANRTSLNSYRGPGLEEGLSMLRTIKQKYGYKILTDIHEASQVDAISSVADVIQIPAFLCRQTDLLVAAAKSKAIINIKKGQFMNPSDMQYSVAKVLQTRGCSEVNYEASKENGVWLTERGTTFGYGNLVVDMRALVIMRQFAPVVFDATHAVQMPGGANGKSSGDRTMVPHLARAAAAVGVDGYFFETHYAPDEALSDGANMLDLESLEQVVTSLQAIENSMYNL